MSTPRPRSRKPKVLTAQERLAWQTARLAQVVGWESLDDCQTFAWAAPPGLLAGAASGDCRTPIAVLGLFDATERAKLATALCDLVGQQRSFAVSLAALQPGRRWRLTGNVEIDESGVTRYFGVLKDISQESLTAIAFLDSRARLDLALEAAGVGLWEWRFDALELHWDAVTTSLLGLRVNADKLRLPSLWRRLGLEQIHALRRLPLELAGSTAPACGELCLRRRGSEPLFLRYRCRLLRGGRERPDRIIGAVWDVSAEKQRERLLEEHREQLRELVAAQTADVLRAREAEGLARNAQTAFFLNASHELRTPLHSMIGFTELALENLEGLEAGERARGWLNKAEAAARKQLRLVDELLDLAKLQSADLSLSRCPTEFAPLLRDCVDEQRPMLAAKAISLELALPAVASRIHADPQRLQQAIRNLLSNAIRFTPNDGRIEISLAPLPEATAPLLWRVSVADSGCGIEAAELESIFERFKQGSRTQAIKGGTGLGLPIAREIARAHGGNLHAHNHPGGGACFVLEIPAQV